MSNCSVSSKVVLQMEPMRGPQEVPPLVRTGRMQRSKDGCQGAEKEESSLVAASADEVGVTVLTSGNMGILRNVNK